MDKMLTPSPQMQPYFLYQPPPTPPLSQLQSDGFNLNNKVSPSMLLIIIILAIIFFVSGLLHLLVRYLVRPSSREPDDVESVTALQGQLQQLFHLHDAGVDQYFIDTLPVFNYKAIIGLKDPFDCAVCLCEFEPEDKLRLLPMCSHAFHMECIDTWLLSHSNCPLCRASLLSDFSPHIACPSVVLALESGSEDSREFVTDREANVVDRNNSSLSTNSHLGLRRKSDLGSSRIKTCETGVKDRAFGMEVAGDSAEKVVTVKLGKFKNVDGGEGGGSSSNGNVDARRCFSMGSFEYVMDENSSLRVPIRTPMKKQSVNKKPSLPLIPGYRAAMSEYDCESKREFDGFEAMKSFDNRGNAKMNSVIGGSNKESFSVSKSWIRGKDKSTSEINSSRRAFSFRFPLNRNAFPDKEKNDKDGARRTKSEIGISRWENGGDEESQSRNIMDSQASAPSFARRTLLWLVGKQSQNKVVHSSSPPHV